VIILLSKICSLLRSLQHFFCLFFGYSFGSQTPTKHPICVNNTDTETESQNAKIKERQPPTKKSNFRDVLLIMKFIYFVKKIKIRKGHTNDLVLCSVGKERSAS